MTELREHLPRQMEKEIVTCPVDSFFSSYRPFKPTEKEISACMRALEEQPSLLSEGKWVDFRTAPSKRDANENTVFAPLKRIAERLSQVNLNNANTSDPPVATAGTEQGDSHVTQDQHLDDKLRRHPNAKWKYQSEPNTAIPGEQIGSNNKVDGYFCSPFPQSDTVTLGDVSVVCEYKKNNKPSDVFDVSSQTAILVPPLTCLSPF